MFSLRWIMKEKKILFLRIRGIVGIRGTFLLRKWLSLSRRQKKLSKEVMRKDLLRRDLICTKKKNHA